MSTHAYGDTESLVASSRSTGTTPTALSNTYKERSESILESTKGVLISAAQIFEKPVLGAIMQTDPLTEYSEMLSENSADLFALTEETITKLRQLPVTDAWEAVWTQISQCTKEHLQARHLAERLLNQCRTNRDAWESERKEMRQRANQAALEEWRMEEENGRDMAKGV